MNYSECRQVEKIPEIGAFERGEIGCLTEGPARFSGKESG